MEGGKLSLPRSARFTPGKDRVPTVQEALFQSNIPELGGRAEPQNLQHDSWRSSRDSNLVHPKHELEASPPDKTCSGRQSKNSGMTFIRKFIRIQSLYQKLLWVVGRRHDCAYLERRHCNSYVSSNINTVQRT